MEPGEEGCPNVLPPLLALSNLSCLLPSLPATLSRFLPCLPSFPPSFLSLAPLPPSCAGRLLRHL